jgi:hypothetical protein
MTGVPVIEQQTLTDMRQELRKLEADAMEQARQGRLDAERLKHLADLRAVAAFRLRPVPADPVEHVRAGYAFIRPHLERLAQHPSTKIASLTNEDGSVYHFRPRTVLRRVLDHALDHLNQIDQWVLWQEGGVEPDPTDGWASSAETLDEDGLPLTETDLTAWLWRIDITWHMLAERASRLSNEQLEWTPPGDDWNLARVLHHVSGGFYVVWLDNPLPEDPSERFIEASRRLYHAIDEVAAVTDDSVTWQAGGARTTTPDQIVSMLVETEKGQ